MTSSTRISGSPCTGPETFGWDDRGNATDLNRWLTAARHRRITFCVERFFDNAVVGARKRTGGDGSRFS